MKPIKMEKHHRPKRCKRLGRNRTYGAELIYDSVTEEQLHPCPWLCLRSLLCMLWRTQEGTNKYSPVLILGKEGPVGVAKKGLIFTQTETDGS